MRIVVQAKGLSRRVRSSLGLVLLCPRALVSCTTFKPPHISYDDEQLAILRADLLKPV